MKQMLEWQDISRQGAHQGIARLRKSGICLKLLSWPARCARNITKWDAVTSTIARENASRSRLDRAGTA